MAASVCPVLSQRVRAFSSYLGLAIGVASLLALGGWAVGPGLVRHWFPAFHPLGAVSIAAAALALTLGHSRRPLARASRLSALIPLAYGVLTLLLDLVHPSGGLLALIPLPALQSSVSLVLLALALLCLEVPPRRGHTLSETFALLCLVLPYLALVGYAFGLGLGTPMRPFRGMSLYMAVTLVLLGLGALCARPDRGQMALLTGNTPGSSVLRRLAPAAVWAPIVLGWLHLQGERLGLFQAEMGSALITLTMSAVGLGLILWNVETLNRSEAERARYQSALEQSESRYRLVAEYSSDLLTLHSPGGDYRYVSPASRRLLGYEPSELVGTSPFRLIAEPDRPRVDETRRKLLAEPGSVTIRYRVRRKDGELVWFESTIQDVPADIPGQIEAMLVVSRDVTQRVAAEAALRESEERYRRLVELSPEAIMVDRDGRLIFVNPAGATLVGAADASHLIGRSLLEFVHPDDVAAFTERMRRARTDHRETLVFEAVLVRLDGSEVAVEATASPIAYGGREAVIVIIRNITERKRAIEEIAMRTAELQKATELDRLKDHFLSTLSHEMKTPLSLIVGYSELLEEKYPHEELLKGVQDGARRLTEHIDSMLDYSALLSGTLPLYKSEVYLREVVETAVHITASLREANGQRLVTHLDPATPAIVADPRRLTQIMVELLDNASKFTPRGGTVGLDMRPVDGHVRLEVWDTGQGIAPEELGQIWEPFAQLAIGNAGRRGGLGLGLTIARKLTELHGGTIEVASEPGRGSRFTVVLPLES